MRIERWCLLLSLVVLPQFFAAPPAAAISPYDGFRCEAGDTRSVPAGPFPVIGASQATVHVAPGSKLTVTYEGGISGTMHLSGLPLIEFPDHPSVVFPGPFDDKLTVPEPGVVGGPGGVSVTFWCDLISDFESATSILQEACQTDQSVDQRRRMIEAHIRALTDKMTLMQQELPKAIDRYLELERRAQELFASYDKLSAYLSELGLAAPAVVPVDTISVTTDYYAIAPALPAELSATHAVPAVQLALTATAGLYRAYGEALQAMNIAQRDIRFYREEIDALPGWIAAAQQQLADLQAEPCAPIDTGPFEFPLAAPGPSAP